MALTSDSRPVTEASLGELVAIATRDVSLLVRQELELAKAEATESAKSVGLGATFLAVAGGLGFFAAIAGTIAFGEGLVAAGLSQGLAFLAVMGVYLVIAGLLGLFALARFKRVKPPKRTMRTVKDDVAWIKHPTLAPTTTLEDA